MTPSWRKPAGALLILALIGLWVVLIASVSGIVGQWHWLLQLGFYLVTGVVWIWLLPMRRLLAWMEAAREDIDGPGD